jgi:DNA-binding MarR family transcriptional regulator
MKIEKYLNQSPIFALNAAYEAIITPVNRHLKKDQFNLLQGLVLTALFFEEHDEVRPSQLADIFKTSRGNMSHILSALEAQRYLRRVVNPQDARQFRIELRAEGRKKALALIKFFDHLQDLFEKDLGSPSCQKTVDGLHALVKTYKKNNDHEYSMVCKS